jgi:hypothetical protein
MPGNAEGRPLGEGAASNADGRANDLDVDSNPETEPIWVQLRRRRRAALRMPPLANGKRDPIDLWRRDGAA